MLHLSYGSDMIIRGLHSNIKYLHTRLAKGIYSTRYSIPKTKTCPMCLSIATQDICSSCLAFHRRIVRAFLMRLPRDFVDRASVVAPRNAGDAAPELAFGIWLDL
jgi:hypothetical protein